MNRLVIIFILISYCSFGQVLNQKKEFTYQDSLRGTNNEFRNWWNVLKYDIEIEPDFNQKAIKGKSEIYFEVDSKKSGKIIQIDLQEPMKIEKIFFDEKDFKNYKRD